MLRYAQRKLPLFWENTALTAHAEEGSPFGNGNLHAKLHQNWFALSKDQTLVHIETDTHAHTRQGITHFSLRFRVSRTIICVLLITSHHSLFLPQAEFGVSADTVRRRLHETELHNRTPAKKPYLSEQNKAARLAFARAQRDLPQDCFNLFVWRDEKSFVSHQDGRMELWRRDGSR